MRLKKVVLNTALTAAAVLAMSGCSALKEGFASQMEVPTLENQANRVAIGMTIVRENNIMVFKSPISADAQWPSKVGAELTEKDKKMIDQLVMDDPYFATVHYTKAVQRKMLGSSALMNAIPGGMGGIAAQVLDQTVSPLTYRAFQKIAIFFKNPDLKDRTSYGSDERYFEAVRKNYPNIFAYDTSLSNFLEFKTGKMIDIEAPTGDVYDTIGAAVISLAPVNLQKDLEEARTNMLESYDDVASIKAKKGELKNTIESKKSSEADKQKAKQDLDVVETKLSESESIADEKEKIYFTLLDEAVVALESDLNIDDKTYVNLAKNINKVATEVEASSTEAYTAFGLALTNIISSGILQKFPKELESLAVAKANVPANLQDKYNTRIKRLGQNALYLLPNTFIGTYYAHKQSVLAEKYEDMTNVILEAVKVKEEQAKEAAEAKAEEEAKAKAEAK